MPDATGVADVSVDAGTGGVAGTSGTGSPGAAGATGGVSALAGNGGITSEVTGGTGGRPVGGTTAAAPIPSSESGVPIEPLPLANSRIPVKSIPVGERCETLTLLQCVSGSYCKTDNGCGGRVGTCVELPLTCDAIEDPVCGCDNETYNNACEAAAAGKNIVREGECLKAEDVCTPGRCPLPGTICSAAYVGPSA